MKKINARFGLSATINQVGSMFTLFFSDKKVVDYDTAKTSDTARFSKYFQSMLARGIYLAPSQYEAMFISAAITQQHVDSILQAHEESLKA